ncbi:MAG: virulence RhuM family protein [Fibrobacter sp.]|nr:virulence RhuM family protein [Fibrobacter sp.]
MQIAFSDKPVQYYNLDMIISVGYRVNSVRATQFRIWATSIIKQYMLKGYVVNHNVVSEQKYEDLKRAMARHQKSTAAALRCRSVCGE